MIAFVKYMNDRIDRFSSRYDYHLERRVLFWFILKVEIDSLRSESVILLFRMWSLFARMLLPTLVLFVLVIEKFSCLEVSSCWKFKAIHSVSGEFLLYNLWSNNACLYTIICSGRARLHSKWIFIKDCILFWTFCVIFSAVAEAESNNCFSWGDSVGKCQISEL